MNGLDSDEIAAIETQLGCTLPEDVRKQYSESDGLRGPTNCSLLYSLNDEQRSSIIQANKLLSEDWFPKEYRRFAIVGDDGCGNLVCYDPASHQAVLWNPEDGDWPQETRDSVTELWDLIRSQYEDPASDL